MHAAMHSPTAMSRLVNLHGPGFPELRLWALRTLLCVPGVRSALARVVRIAPLRWAHANVHYYDESLKSLEEARVYGEPLGTPEGAEAFTRILRDSVDPVEMRRFQRSLAALEGRFVVPLQLIYAAEDPMVPASFGPRFASLLPDAEFVVLEEASHFAHVDATPRFVDAVLPFLQS